MSLISLVARLFKKRNGLSFKGMAALFLFPVVFFVWLIPLGYKHYYVKRLGLVDDVFEDRNPKKASMDGDIMIALAESAYDSIM